MAKIFRKLRLNSMGSVSGRKYILYAIGEILLVVIGILIALQINNINEERKNRKEEKILLSNFIIDIKNDLDAFDLNIASTTHKMLKIDSLFELLKSPVKHRLEELIKYNLGIPSVDVFLPTSGTYDEAISSGKMALIQDVETRKNIFTYYRNLHSSGTDGVINKFVEEVIFPEWGELVFPSKEILGYLGIESNLPSIDIKQLANNKKYNQLIAQKYASQGSQIENWQHQKESAQGLLNQVKNELENK